jgi:hypothetical protein
MRKWFLFFYLLVFFIALNSCSDEFNLLRTEIKLIDDYEELTAIYSNIGVYDSIHFIRVNRGFAAEDFTLYSDNADSLFYDPDDINVSMYIMKVNDQVNGNILAADTLATFLCSDTVIHVENSGQIGSTELTLYYFKEHDLSQFGFEDIYLGVEVLTKQNKVFGHTKLVDGGKFSMPQYAQTFPIENNTFDVFIIPPKDAQSLLVEMHCQYFEVKITEGNADTVYYTFDVLLTNDIYNNVIVNEEVVRYRNNTAIFFDNLEKDILKNGDTINTIFRKLHKLYFSTMVGNTDLVKASTVLTYNGFTFNDLPVYITNIKNGLGYFSCYGSSVTRKYYYSQKTVNKVIELYGQKYGFSGE